MFDKHFITKHISKSLYNNAFSRARYALLGVVWKEISTSFVQFFTWRYPIRSLWRTSSIICSSLTRMFLGRSLKYSFSFTGEDRIIESILKPRIQYSGCYVDVGCNHPKFLSNTYHFYRKGWRGICVDANPALIKKFAYFRPRDKAVCALVSDSPIERDFYLVENDVLSTTEVSIAKDTQLEYKKVTMRACSLTSILDQYQIPSTFDILSIDTEEHDFNVLKSLDFSQYRPKIVIVEDESFHITNHDTNQIVSLMDDHGYKLVGFALKNLYFISI